MKTPGSGSRAASSGSPPYGPHFGGSTSRIPTLGRASHPSGRPARAAPRAARRPPPAPPSPTPAPASPPPVANATSKLFPSKKNAHQRGKAKGFGGRRGVTLRRGGSASRPLPPSGSVGRRHRCSCPYRASPPALPPPKKFNIELRKKTLPLFTLRVLRSCGSTSDRRHASPL